MPAPSSVDSPSRASLSAYYVQEDLQSHLLDMFVFCYSSSRVRKSSSSPLQLLPLANRPLLRLQARLHPRSRLRRSPRQRLPPHGHFRPRRTLFGSKRGADFFVGRDYGGWYLSSSSKGASAGGTGAFAFSSLSLFRRILTFRPYCRTSHPPSLQHRVYSFSADGSALAATTRKGFCVRRCAFLPSVLPLLPPQIAHC